MATTRIQNNQITDSTITYAKIASGTLVGSNFNPNLTLNSNVSIIGNLSIQGNTTTVNSNDTYINDPVVVFNNGYVGSLTGYDIGLLMNRNLSSLAGYGSVNTFFGWVENDSAFEAFATTATGAYGTSLQTLNNSGYANVKIGNTTVVGALSATTISAGAINNTVIGNVTPSSASFTTAQATNFSTGNALITGGNINAITNFSTGNAVITGASTYIGTSGTNIANVYAGQLYDGGSRVVSTSSGTGNLTITGNSISLALTGPGATTWGDSTHVPQLTFDAYGRLVTASNITVSTTINLAGTTGTGSVAGGQTLTFAGTYGVTESVSGSTVTIATPQDLRATAAPTFAGVTSNGNIVANAGSTSLTLYGNALVSNTGIINFGSISNVQIAGGTSGYAVTTNGTGTLNFTAANAIVLGANASGQLVSNAVTLTSTTDVTDAIALLNSILGKLTPTAPSSFPTSSLTTSTAQYNGYMTTGWSQTDNSGWGNLAVTAGTLVSTSTRLTTLALTSITNNGTTASGGNIQLYVNGVIPASSFHAFGTTPSSSDNGTYGQLVVSGTQDYHNVSSSVAAGFWYVFSVSSSLTGISSGWNRTNLYYTGDAASTNNLTWYYDASTSTPSFSATSMSLSSNTVTYSSTIPHLNSSAGFTLNGTVQNLSGDLYYSAWTSTSSNFFSSTGAGGALLAPANRTLAQVGVPLPLTRNNTSAYSFSTTSNVTTGFGSATATTGPAVSVSTPYATTSSGTFQPGNIILYKTGTSTQIEETSLTSSFGTTARITNPDGGTAADNPAYTGTETTFNSQTSTLLSTDATVVAAVLKYDVTNYSTGYYPIGPNLSSGRAASQYFTFKFNYAALSSFYIHYTGTLAGLWIACPGVTDTPASPTNGWLNAAAAYAGSGVPGGGTGGNGNAGCAVGGNATLNSNGTYSVNVTFGSVNTSSAGNKSNEVYVRVKLTSGQSLTALYLATS